MQILVVSATLKNEVLKLFIKTCKGVLNFNDFPGSVISLFVLFRSMKLIWEDLKFTFALCH